ncbi:MAG TPA: hypothetical protein P5104_03050 [Bacteroidales bacterium]|nr:hypothetical protein [Bacteroidales bacterium]
MYRITVDSIFFYLVDLSLLFVLLVTGIGSPVVVFSGYYLTEVSPFATV